MQKHMYNCVMPRTVSWLKLDENQTVEKLNINEQESTTRSLEPTTDVKSMSYQ